MRIVLATFFAASVFPLPAVVAAERMLDCSSPSGTATAELDFDHGTAIWSTTDAKTGQTSRSELRLSVENGQYALDTGHSIGRYEPATGTLTWFYRDRAFASASCRAKD